MANDKWTKRNGYLSLAGIKYWRSVWDIAGIRYVAGDGVHNAADGSAYICILEHTSDADSRPGVGTDWELYWDLLVAGSNSTIPVTQTAHGFSIGNYVKMSAVAGVYELAQADSLANAQGIGFVTSIDGVNGFTLTQNGYVENSSVVPAQPAGTVMYLDSVTAGDLTNVRPTANNSILKPVAVIVQSGVSMWILSDSPTVVKVGGGTGGVESVTSSDTIFDVDNSDPDNPVGSIDVIALANDTTFIDELTTNTEFIANIETIIDDSGIPGSIDTQENDVTVDATTTKINFKTPGGVLSNPVPGQVDVDLNALIAGIGGAGGTLIDSDATTHSIAQNIVGTTETTIYTVPVPAGTLGTKNAIRTNVLFDDSLNLNNGAQATIRVKYGGTTIGSILLESSGATVTAGFSMKLENIILAAGSASSQKNYTKLSLSQDGIVFQSTAPQISHNGDGSEYTVSSVDSSDNQDIEITIQYNAIANSLIVSEGIIVEKITEEVSGGSNTIPLIAGNTFTGGISPQSFIVMEGQELIIKADTTTFSANFGDVDSNSKYCFQLNVKEGQSVNIDLIKIIQITGIGTNSDNLKLSIQANSAGAPDGVDIHSSTIAGFTGTATKDFSFTPFELNAPIGGGDKNYFVVLERTGSLSVTNYYTVSLQNTGGTNQSPKKYNSSTLVWSNDNRTICNSIYYTYLDGVAYVSTRGDSGTASANGKTGTLVAGSRIFCYDVSSGGGGWYTDSIFAKTNGANIGRSRGFIKTNAVPGATVIGIVAGIVSGFTGLEPGKSYSLPTSGAAGTLLQFAASANDVGVGQAITSTSVLIHRESA